MDEKPRKRIIGVLGDELNYELPIKAFRTLKKLTGKNGMEMHYFVADAFKVNKGVYYQSNILYDFISRDILDGLIIMSNILLIYITPEEFIEKCRQYPLLPIVSMGLELPGIPSVLVDNESGVYTAVKHLIEVHHHTRIGFIQGLSFHPDAQVRFKAYSRAMEDHNLPVNPLLIFQGDFLTPSGNSAIKEMIETRQQLPGRDIDALVCANDYMAIGAQMELLDRGYNIPGDIALVGFDDIIYSKCMIPALSSIIYPDEESTARAFALLLDLMKGNRVPKTVSIPTEFIPRSSCGCVKLPVQNFSAQMAANSESLIHSSYNSFIQNLNRKISSATILQIQTWQDALAFLQTYNQWQENNQEDNQAAIFTRTAYSLLGSTAQNSLLNGTYEVKINTLSISLSSTLDLTELLKILVAGLPDLRIRKCYLNLYENPADYSAPDRLPPWSNMILAFHDEEGRIVREELPARGLRFRTCELVPGEMIAKYGYTSWIVAALFFDQEQLGFVLLDCDAFTETIYYVFRRQLSSCLKSALLLKEYQNRSRKLAAANATIQEFNKRLENENLRIKMEMDVARSIQTALLPNNVTNIHPDFEIASLMIPATEVGGDYFDIALDEQQNLWIGIGDVSGHGLKAGMIMMIAQSAQTTITANNDVTPRDVIIGMNRVLFRSVTNRMKENQYMTCSIIKYLNQGRFQYAGVHLNFLIYRQKDKTCEEVHLDGVWLNIVKDIEKVTENSEFTLDTGDVLVLYTDGITEVANQAKQLLDIKGLKTIILRHGNKNINAMLDAIKDDVKSWSAGIDKDDMSLVLIRRIH